LNFDDYLKYLENLGFKILEVVDIPELLGFKNNSPAKMIVAKKL
jgi:phosphosulfolactate synthase (CoM biosynthesis protein A)